LTDYLNPSSPQPTFAQEYAARFDPHNLHDPGDYGYQRANDETIIMYDALDVFCTAATAAFADVNVLSNALTNGDLKNLSDALAATDIQGLSGQIAFAKGQAVDKTVLIISLNEKSQNAPVDYQGKYN
jgi:hypothetical protein